MKKILHPSYPSEVVQLKNIVRGIIDMIGKTKVATKMPIAVFFDLTKSEPLSTACFISRGITSDGSE
jgi:hypothetical protein